MSDEVEDCNCVDMKWVDQDFNDIETAICKMCNEDIHEIIDNKDEVIRKAEAENNELAMLLERALDASRNLQTYRDLSDQYRLSEYNLNTIELEFKRLKK